jgi:hypothetical protein
MPNFLPKVFLSGDILLRISLALKASLDIDILAKSGDEIADLEGWKCFHNPILFKILALYAKLNYFH